jgi:hypothetical protein
VEVEHDSWWPGTQTAWRLCDDSPTASPGFATGTTWTSGPRADGFNYYYYKVATVNVNWSSAASPSTPRRYIASGNCS